jgi:uncharacterized protein
MLTWRKDGASATEAVMKAALALVVIYIGTFLVAIQGASQNSAQAAAPEQAAAQAVAKPIDPVKEADIRALLELLGARDMVHDGVTASAEQYREKLLATVANNEKGQAFVTSFVSNYQKKYDADQVSEQLVGIYDKHYSEEEIKGLLQFYGSPLGQRVAAEMPRISQEIQTVARAEGKKAATESLLAVKAQDPNAGAAPRPAAGQRRWQPKTGTESSQALPAETPPQ